jgi:hypothetical protein
MVSAPYARARLTRAQMLSLGRPRGTPNFRNAKFVAFRFARDGLAGLLLVGLLSLGEIALWIFHERGLASSLPKQ